MMRQLRQVLGSGFMTGIFACVIAMLVAMPVLRAHAEGALCHPAQTAGTPASSVAHHHDGHAHAASHDQFANAAGQHTTNEQNDRSLGTQLKCCLPGIGLAALASPIGLEPTAMAATLPSLTVVARIDGLNPSAPRKPPRTTCIAALPA